MLHICPSCASVGKVAASRVGKRTRCGQCGFFSLVVAPEWTEDEPEEEPEGKPLSEVIASVVIVVLLVGSCAGLMTWGGNSDDDYRRLRQERVQHEARQRLQDEERATREIAHEIAVQAEMERQRRGGR